jgi:hypothetical protein
MPFRAGSRAYPELSAEQRSQLARIEPSVVDEELRYWPCSVTLKDGTIVDRVYIVAAQPYINTWGVWPDQDSFKHEVRIEEVVAIRPSPTRIPKRFADVLYGTGESGMGYTVFTAVFRDGTSRAYIAGNAIDFIDVPSGLTAEDIIEVRPHIGRERAIEDRAPYFWCIHGIGASHVA